MKKLLFGLAAITMASTVFAGEPVTFPIVCSSSVSINESSPLMQVQKCAIDKQKMDDGMYKVEFTDNNKHEFECYFANDKPLAKINHCEHD